MINRLRPVRSALIAAMIATSAVSVPSLLYAQTAPLTQSQAGYYRIMIGEVEVIALSDGTLPLDTALLNADKPKEIAALLAKSFLKSPVDVSVNAFLVKAAGKLILVDTGTAELFGPTLNKLPASLHSVGYAPEQITDILLTHIHTDHTGGLMNGSRRVFPNASVHVERKEVTYWMDPANKQKAPENQKIFFDQAALKFKPYVDSGQVKPFDGATELFPGIRSIPAPGHTPGHSLYSLESRGEKLVFWGDIFHVPAVQLSDPSVTIQYDVDTRAAAQQRKLLLADAAQKKYMIAPAHMSFPGFGHLSREEEGDEFHRYLRVEGNEYRFYPVAYVNDATAGAK